ncbi:HEPN-associated N-terminal domain-containing protein [Denitromonas sp.]|uniref:HEPN-associated N-terminal domain-containing protein n=1 Tax=Denitromonas sp. TaxID=2734609 RepID=UPI002B00192B|nr:HEPN-associated N-terminal domain-containing protein [Denitromonas sp.]
MGLAKAQMMRDEEQGWSAPDKYVCADCVEDPFLKSLIERDACARLCDYCDEASDSDIAAPVETILEAVASTLTYYYSEPTAAGVPYDGEWLVEPTFTEDALSGIPFVANDGLFEDVASAFDNTAWVPAADGHWCSEHKGNELVSAWDAFSDIVKHQSRFFFLTPSGDGNVEGVESDDWYALGPPSPDKPSEILNEIAKAARDFELVRSVDAGTTYFRVRERSPDSDWKIDGEHMGPPPSELATAGRMNPAGIAYTYLGETPGVAIAEVLKGPPETAAVACFRLRRTIRLLDLTQVPEPPSVFDETRRARREVLSFFHRFLLSISQPVQKDGKEHINYVPSQIVCEYFSQVFRTEGGRSLDGIVYPSAVCPPGRNVVLFPEDDWIEDSSLLEFVSGEVLELTTWRDFQPALSLRTWADVMGRRRVG